jgi:AraC-like DNA-binding protein
MSLTGSPLLDRYPFLRTRSPDEAHAVFANYGLRFDIDPRACRRLDVRVNSTPLSGMFLGYTHYGSPASLLMDERANYWIKLPLRGHLDIAFRGGSVTCDRYLGAVLSPTREYRMRSEEGGARLTLVLTKDDLVRHLTTLLDEPLAAPLEFQPSLNLTGGFGQRLARFITLAVLELEGSDSLLRNPLAARDFVEFVMTGLLTSHPHNYTHALQHRCRPIAPSDLKRAVDFIEANLNAPISLVEVAAAAGVPGRTLFHHFHRFLGVTPMHYVRRARLQRVHDRLCRAGSETSVTEAAVSCGFTHLGRFSAEYRKQFGESPSETLRRNCRARRTDGDPSH